MEGLRTDNNHSRVERVYVKVSAVIDADGSLHPCSITWTDGRVFRISEVKGRHDVGVLLSGRVYSWYYTVVINGLEKKLFCEKADRRESLCVARWYVERVVNEKAG
jgi:hypothetical protein